jgi:hypothetical protein
VNKDMYKAMVQAIFLLTHYMLIKLLLACNIDMYA